MSLNLSKKEGSRQRWGGHIQTRKQSGLAQKEFSEQRHVGLSTFQRWHRKLTTQEKAKGPAVVSFLSVGVVGPGDSGITVLVDDRLRIEISTGFDANTLKQVIVVLQAG